MKKEKISKTNDKEAISRLVEGDSMEIIGEGGRVIVFMSKPSPVLDAIIERAQYRIFNNEDRDGSVLIMDKEKALDMAFNEDFDNESEGWIVLNTDNTSDIHHLIDLLNWATSKKKGEVSELAGES